MTYQKKLHGKNIVNYRPISGTITVDTLINYLKNFQLCSALKLIGNLSCQNALEWHNEHCLNWSTQGTQLWVPIRDSILAYISMVLISCSNDYRSKIMAEDDLCKAIDMYFGLLNSIENEPNNVDGLLIRLGFSQFDYDRDIRTHQFARTLLIYNNLWINYNKENINIGQEILKLTGFNVEQTLTLGYFFIAYGCRGYFSLVNCLDPRFEYLSEIVTLENQLCFTKWLSCNYQEFRDIFSKESQVYRTSRFNPLIKKPVLQIERNVNQKESKTYVIPVPRLIYEKMTNGLYYELTQVFSSKGHNRFRSAFGNVFQEYVGLLLKDSIGENKIISEFKYGSSSDKKDSIDWIVINGRTAILIEVKQSCLYLSAKQTGDIHEVEKSLRNTIGKGVEQLWNFKSAVNSSHHDDLNCLSEIEKIESLIIIFDRAYFLNSSIRDKLKELNHSISSEFHWHAITIEEFETFLSLAGTSLFESLERKRMHEEFDKLDFREYSIQEFQERDFSNPFLMNVYDDWRKKVGVDVCPGP
jgi:hypothetical protein